MYFPESRWDTAETLRMDQVIPSFEVSCWTVVAEKGDFNGYKRTTYEKENCNGIWHLRNIPYHTKYQADDYTMLH